MKRFVTVIGLSILLGVSLTAVSGLFCRRGIDFARRGAPFCWIETQGIGFLGVDAYVIHQHHLIVDLVAWTSISSVLLAAYLFRSREQT